MRLRAFVVVLLMMGPLVVARRGREPLEAWARVLGQRLGATFPAVTVEETDLTVLAATVPVQSDDLEPLEAEVAASAPSPRPVRRGSPDRGHALFVDASTVLRLAESGHVPVGEPVGPRGRRPAGIELHSVAVLGVGVRDGDVLTDVGGHPVRTEGEVIAAVLSARAHRAPRVSARFFRGSTPWSLTVEMPYLDGR